MELDKQKELIQFCQPLLKEELFSKNELLCIIPLDWWNTWCLYVGFYGQQSTLCPKQIDTSLISLQNKANHAYITTQAWKLLKSWYGATKKIEVFLVNNQPDLDLYEVLLEIDNSMTTYIKISLKLKVYQIKKYICKKFKKDTSLYKLKLKTEDGYTRNLKDLNRIINKNEVASGALVLCKTEKLQIDTSNLATIENTIENVSNDYWNTNDMYIVQNYDVEMQDMKNEINVDSEGINSFKCEVNQALKGEKFKFRIKSLKKIRAILEEQSNH